MIKKKAIRNPFVTPMKSKKGGRMSNKKNKRRNGRNKQQDYLNEDY